MRKKQRSQKRNLNTWKSLLKLLFSPLFKHARYLASLPKQEQKPGPLRKQKRKLASFPKILFQYSISLAFRPWIILFFLLINSGCTSSSSTSNLAVSLPYSPYSFSGITSIDNVGTDSVRLNWSPAENVSDYYIYNLTNGTPVLLTTLSATSSSTPTSYVVTELKPETAYTFRVRMVDTNGLRDNNTSDVAATTMKAIIAHQGWNMAKALGGRTPVTQATGLSATSASITVGWNPMSINSGSISSYNLYRATTSGGQDFSVPLKTDISATNPSYTDLSVTSGSTYYYVVRPVFAGKEYTVSSAGNEIKITVPPVNMSLVHRWVANAEICSLMGRTADPENNYRCAYVGPGNTSGYYDLGKDLYMDTVEMGCNYTPANATASLSCNDSTNGCIGAGVPAAAVADGQVYYDRQNATCYLRTGGAWVAANSLTTAAEYTQIASSQPGLPPLALIDQSHSWSACQAFSVAGIGAKRLPSRKEQLVASAWASNLSHSQISYLENGTNLPDTGACNSNSAHGLVFSSGTIPTDLETIAGNSSSSIRAVRTGSNSTKNCISRYGIQDIVGNVWEWSTDQLGSCAAGAPYGCVGVTSAIDATNTDFNGIPFDGTAGPGGGAVDMTNWDFTSQTNNTTQFLVPLGLPFVTSAASSYDALPIGFASGQFNSQNFHLNRFWYSSATGGVSRGSLMGGSWTDIYSGRFAFAVNNAPTNTHIKFGLRCVVSVNP